MIHNGGAPFSQRQPALSDNLWYAACIGIPQRQFRSRFAKAMEIFEAGIDDVLSYLHYPQPHRVRISSTNPLERLNLEIRRGTRVLGIFPNPGACLRLIGMLAFSPCVR